jgi:peptide/nickel transport system permease protein
MLRYILTRIALIIPALLIATIVIFLLLRVLPGDVALTILSGSQHTEAMREALREELGLNDPLPVQYARWLWSMLRGRAGGVSLETREPIATILARQLPVTLLLAGYGMLVSVALSLPLGVVAALTRDRWPDRLIRVASLAGLSIPAVFAALLVSLLLLRLFRWSPPIIYLGPLEDVRAHLALMLWPALLLAWEYSSHLVRVTRASLLDVLAQDYIAAARAKGVGELSLVVKYGLRNALMPVVTVMGTQFGVLLSGSLVLETVFGLPGVGRGIVHAALARDYPVVQTTTAVLVLLFLVVNLGVDLLYARADPRVVYHARQGAG